MMEKKQNMKRPIGYKLPKVEISVHDSPSETTVDPSESEGLVAPEFESAEPKSTTVVQEVTKVMYRADRRRLPQERQAITHKFSIDNQEGYITVGLYEDGTPGEIFIRMAKTGSTMSGLLDAFALCTSLALQYGVPLEVLINKFNHQRFEPSGQTQNPSIPEATSITDYLGRWLAQRFLSPEAQSMIGFETTDTVSDQQLTLTHVSHRKLS